MKNIIGVLMLFLSLCSACGKDEPNHASEINDDDWFIPFDEIVGAVELIKIEIHSNEEYGLIHELYPNITHDFFDDCTFKAEGSPVLLNWSINKDTLQLNYCLEPADSSFITPSNFCISKYLFLEKDGNEYTFLVLNTKDVDTTIVVNNQYYIYLIE